MNTITPTPPRSRAALTVFLKEVRENLRDRRTLISAFLTGPLLGPILFVMLINVTLNRELDKVETRRDASNWIVNAPSTIAATREFFQQGRMPGCRAGHRFLVVTSDGWLQPCSMVFKK